MCEWESELVRKRKSAMTELININLEWADEVQSPGPPTNRLHKINIK